MTTVSTTAAHSLASTTADGPAGEIFTGVFVAGLAIVGIALVTLFVAALISILRSRLDTLPKLAWVGIVLILQLVGPLLWFAMGRRLADGTANRQTPVLDR